MRELGKVLNRRERVFWEGKPNFWPFVLGSSIVFVLFGGMWTLFTIPFIMLGAFGRLFFFLPHFWIGPLMLIGGPLYMLLVHSRMYYAITNKRVIIQKGLIGRDFEIVDFDKITNAEVNVGIADKLLSKSSGSILISTAGTFTYSRQGNIQRPYTLRNIPEPYKVFRLFKKISHAIKTDIEYPNKYRPRTNPGYRTAYNIKKKKTKRKRKRRRS